jgi:tellurite resistance protein TerC
LTPASHWIWFHVALVLLLVIEYAVARRMPNAHRKAIFAIAMWVVAALALAVVIARLYSPAGATQFLAGYAIEEALSIDNLFVFLLLFRIFAIPEQRQPRVLFWGVLGAIVLRATMILAGLSLLDHFHWVNYLFAVFLLVAAVRLLKPEKVDVDPSATPTWIRLVQKISPVSERTDRFLAYENGRWMATVLLLALIAVELTDVVFALDSIPAVLSITREPFLAYTSNILAVMGLRSLYVLLAAMLARLKLLHFGLAALLFFAAAKMLLSDWIEIGPLLSLGIIAGVLAITIAASLIAARREPPASKLNA